MRQIAVNNDDCQDVHGSAGRLNVRFLPTIPSAADSSMQIDEEAENDGVSQQETYAVLESGQALTTLSSPKDKTEPPWMTGEFV